MVHSIAGIIKSFYFYLELLTSCYCVCFCHRCGNMWYYYQVSCYQFFFSGTPPKVKHWINKPHPCHRILVKLRKIHLHYCLVQLCHCHELQWPPKLYGSFPSHQCSKCWLCMRIISKVNFRQRRRFVAHVFSPTVYYHLKVEEGVTNKNKCDSSNYFLHLPKLLHEFAQQDQTSVTQQDVYILNILKSNLYVWKDVDQVDTFQTIMLS